MSVDNQQRILWDSLFLSWCLNEPFRDTSPEQNCAICYTLTSFPFPALLCSLVLPAVTCARTSCLRGCKGAQKGTKPYGTQSERNVTPALNRREKEILTSLFSFRPFIHSVLGAGIEFISAGWRSPSLHS